MIRAGRFRPILPALAVLGATPGLAQLTIHADFWLSGRKADALGDGLNYWAGSYLARHGHYGVLFDPVSYGAWFARHFGSQAHAWSYSPDYLLFVMGLSLFPPLAGVLIFSISSCLALWASLRAVPLSLAARLAVLASPAALTSVGGGQNGALLGSLLIGGLFLADTYPVLGGALIGLATIKPQLGLLIPFYWLASGRWRALASAAISAIILTLLSLAVFPHGVWPDFLHKVTPFMAHLGEELVLKTQNGPRAMIASMLSMACQFGAGIKLASALQLVSTALAVGTSIWLGRCRMLPETFRLAWLLALGPLATPYIWCYDLIPASCGLALLLAGLPRLTPPVLIFLGLAWVTPGVALFAAVLGLPTFMPLWLWLGLGCWLFAWGKQQPFLNEHFQHPGPHGKGTA